jgi:hypothetical protein
MIIGYTADRSAVATDWSDCPIFDFQSTYAGFAPNTYDYIYMWGIKIINTSGVGVAFDNDCRFGLVWVDSASSYGFDVDIRAQFFQCRVSNCGNAGVFTNQQDYFFFSEFYGNTSFNIQEGSSYCVHVGNYYRDSGYGVAMSIGSSFYLNTVDGHTTRGLSRTNLNSTSLGIVALNQFTNNATGLWVQENFDISYANNYNGNTTAKTVGVASPMGYLGDTAVDPSYGGITTNDYSISAASQIDVGGTPGNVSSHLNIGASQNGAAASGGGGLPPGFGKRY